MVTFWTKSILALPLVAMAILNLLSMLELLGRPQKRFGPRSLKLFHRINGVLFILLFALISYFCLRIMQASGQELSPRGSLHALLAVAAFLLLALKIVTVRFYKKYYSMAAPMGMAVVVLTLTTAGLSAGHYFTMYGSAAVSAPAAGQNEELVNEGASVFARNCADCHYTDKRDTKIGPGLEGLFSRNELPSSGRAVTEENVLEQLDSPYDVMPAFANMPEERRKALIAYLKTL